MRRVLRKSVSGLPRGPDHPDELIGRSLAERSHGAGEWAKMIGVRTVPALWTLRN